MPKKKEILKPEKKHSEKEKVEGQYQVKAGTYFITFQNDALFFETSVTYFLCW